MPTRFATSPGAKIPFLTFTGIAPKNEATCQQNRRPCRMVDGRPGATAAGGFPAGRAEGAMKTKLPFTAGEWDAVRWAAGAVTEAAQADDAARRAARFADLRSILAELRGRYGNHPLLWETEADFTPGPEAAAELYRLAEAAAVAVNWPTLSIRLSLAHVLAEELDQRAEAREALLACRDELPWSLEADCVAWATLLSACPPDVPADLAGSKWGTGRTVAVGGAK